MSASRSSLIAIGGPPPAWPGVLLAVVALCACGARGVHGGTTGGPAAIAGEAVALVDGRAIGAEQIRRQAAAAGTSAREALDALIDSELLAAEAERRGLRGDPEVREAAVAELVRRWLGESFEREVTPAIVTDGQIQDAYQRNADQLDRPEFRVVNHVLVPFGKPPPDATRKQLLRQRAEEVARRARACKSAEEFAALGKALSDGAVTLLAEEVATGPTGNTVKPFANAVFAMARVGDVTGPIETSFGFHVIWLKQIVPPRHVPLTDVRAELRAGLFPEAQRREFARRVDALMEQHHVELHADRLAGDGKP